LERKKHHVNNNINAVNVIYNNYGIEHYDEISIKNLLERETHHINNNDVNAFNVIYNNYSVVQKKLHLKNQIQKYKFEYKLLVLIENNNYDEEI
jgi:hypothetical protein